MTYRIELGEGDTLVEIDGTDLSSPSIKLSHSQLVDWSFDTHYDAGFTTYAETFQPMRIYWDPPVGSQRILFRGVVCRHSREDGGPGSNAISRVEGHDRGFTYLKRSAVPQEIVTYSNISARDAIQSYWDNYTPYEAEVHPQPLENLPDIEEVELTEDHLTNLQKLHDRANFVYTPDHQSPELKVTSMSRGDVKREASWELDTRAESTATNVKHDDDRRNYANIVVGLGSADGGGRIRYDAVNQPEIQRLRDLGCPPEKSCAVKVVSDPDASTMQEVQTMAETELSKAVEERKTKGSIDIIPTWIQPGFAYDVEALGSEDLVLESIDLSIGGTDANATLEFVDEYGYANDIATLRGQINRIVDTL